MTTDLPTTQWPAASKGPASYFPSIDRSYGRPIDEWLDLVRARAADKHTELVDWLEAEHGLGHGHANAIVGASMCSSGGSPRTMSSGSGAQGQAMTSSR